jgi:hypothetical protein
MDVHTDAFNAIKEAMRNPGVLHLPRGDRPLHIRMDASGDAYGGCLMQYDDAGVPVPLNWVSKTFNAAQRLYPVGLKELYAVVHAVRANHQLVLVMPEVVVQSDHHNNLNLLQLSNPMAQRWVFELLAVYRLKFIEHLPGPLMIPGDVLSRNPAAPKDPDVLIEPLGPGGVRSPAAAAPPEAMVAAAVAVAVAAPPAEARLAARAEEDDPPISADDDARQARRNKRFLRQQLAKSMRYSLVIHAQAAATQAAGGVEGEGGAPPASIAVTPFYATIAQAQGKYPDVYNDDNKHFVPHQVGGLLYYTRGGKLVIPFQERDIINGVLDLAHDRVGHGGTTDVEFRLDAAQITWEGRHEDVLAHIRSCPPCQYGKAPTHPETKGVMLTRPSTGPWDVVELDFIGPIATDKKGYMAILSIVDRFTRYGAFVPVTKMTAEVAWTVFCNEIINRHGVPREVHVDQGSHFLAVFKANCAKHGIDFHETGSAHHHEALGTVERANAKFMAKLRACTDTHIKKTEWSTVMGDATMAYNTAVNRSIGMSPYQALYGRVAAEALRVAAPQRTEPWHADAVAAMQELAAIASEAHRLRRKEAHDKKYGAVEFAEGDTVLVFSPERLSKLHSYYTGPYKIIEKLDPAFYDVALLKAGNVLGQKFTVHISLLKAFDMGRTSAELETQRVLDAGEFVVEDVTDHRLNLDSDGDIKIEFKVKWAGYAADVDAWQPEDNLAGNALYKRYISKHQDTFTLTGQLRKDVRDAMLTRALARVGGAAAGGGGAAGGGAPRGRGGRRA